ncbi:extracellular solute-binding protein [Paenibacillus psychroresistens]|uniref:extracellular solute-binding protein n=1 Tax=Paenibacillus psychroresistens TaxID=1778678 RepID=UPI001391AAD3|nr:extracellular solute-binding protein [Paenibacillus psychroresistens]
MELKKLLKKNIVLSLLLLLFLTSDKSTHFIGSKLNISPQEINDLPKAVDHPFKEHLDISVAIWDIDSAFQNAEKDELLQQLQKKFNITLHPVQINWANFQDKIKVWAASDKLPDIFATNLADTDIPLYQAWAKQGIVRALPTDMSKFPHLKAYLQSPEVQLLQIEGKFYAFPRYSVPAIDQTMTAKAILVRKDWMDKLELRDPQSFEEFKVMLKSFVDRDPNGNGKKDEIGLEGNGANSNYLNFVFSPSLPSSMNYYYVLENGKWIPNYVSAKYPKVLTQWRELYHLNLLDPDFAIFKDKEGVDAFAQGKAGALAYSVNIAHIKLASDLWEQYNPGSLFADHVKMLPIWPDANGTRYHYAQGTYWSESYFNANISDAKMERIMYLYDYLMSEEGSFLVKFGRENIDYKLENGQWVSLLKQGEKLNEKYPSLGALSVLAAWAEDIDAIDMPINRKKFGEANFQLFLDSRKWMQANTQAIPLNLKIQSILQLQPIIAGVSFQDASDDAVKIVLGKDNITEAWKAKLIEYEKLGIANQIEAVNKEALKQGIE